MHVWGVAWSSGHMPSLDQRRFASENAVDGKNGVELTFGGVDIPCDAILNFEPNSWCNSTYYNGASFIMILMSARVYEN